MNAVVEAWYPGERGGEAVARILFGEVNPSGRLSMTFPPTTGHIPMYAAQKPSARGFYKSPVRRKIPVVIMSLHIRNLCSALVMV